MLLPLSWLQQKRAGLLFLLLVLPFLSVMTSVCSSSLSLMPDGVHSNGASQRRATTKPLFTAPARAVVSTTAPRTASFLTAHPRCSSLGACAPARSTSPLYTGGPHTEGGGEGPQPPAGPRVQAVLDQLQQLTLLEVSQLVRQLEKVFGVSAAAALGAAAPATAPVAPGGGLSSGPSGASVAPKAPEKTEFKVVVKAVPTASRISVIKTLRSVRSDLGLKEAKSFIDTLPKDVTENISKKEAQKIFDALKSAGAEVEMV